MARLALTALATLATATLTLPAAASPQRYVVEDLSVISPFGGRAFELNDAGVAVGHGLSPTLQQHALVWPGAGVTDLTPSNPLAEAQGISEGGVVVGWARNAGGSTEAVRWVGGVPTFLGMLPGHVGSLAQDVTDSGIVAGWSVTSVGDPVASVWIDGQVQAIAGLQSWAFAVSETGDVVGRQWMGVDIEAFRWRDGVYTVLPDLGPNNALAVGASPAGLIAGGAVSPVEGAFHAVIWDQDLGVTDLGIFAGGFSTVANDVNDDGVAVGNAIIDPVAEIFRAVVFRGNGAEDLNLLLQPGSGWTLFDARAVNARGEIVGVGIKSGSSGERPFRLKPDCDGDGAADLDEIAAGTAHDANQDGLADACQHCQENLGFGGPGALRLTVCGDPLTESASAATLLLTQVPVGQPVVLLAGLVSTPTPFGGGTLVPLPPLAILSPLFADPSGSIALPIVGHAGFPVDIYLQAAAVVGNGFHISNAVRVVLGIP